MWENTLQFVFNVPLKVFVFVIVFTVPLRRRKFFWLRAIPGGLAYLMTFFFIPISQGYLYDIVLLLFSMVWMFLCFRAKIFAIIFCGVGAFAGQHISSYLFRILQILTQIESNGIAGIFISLSICLAVAAACYFILVRRINANTLNSSMSVLITSAVILGLIIICGENIPKELAYANILYCVYAIISCMLSLNVQFGIFKRRELEQKNEETERLLYAERKQQALSKQSIDMVNMKCHDLKHQIELLQEADDQGRRGELIRDLKETIDEYDNIIKTGYEALDTVLTEKNYLCKRNNIKFSYIVDGAPLAFMKELDVYSLFGNALDNAIQSVCREDDIEKRIISLSASSKQGYYHIHIENYFNQKLTFEDGLPITTQSETNIHGYGLRSMRHITEKYKGVMTITAEIPWFKLNILLPVP